LSVSDFCLMEDAGDPKDPDGKLDLDQVEGVGIIDVGVMFAQLGNEQIVDMVGIKMGARKFFIDDFEASETPLPGGDSDVSTVKRLDTFNRPQPNWIRIGDIKVTVQTDPLIQGKGMKAEYKQNPGKAAGFFKRLTRGTLANTGALTFDIASVQPMKLVVQLEEKGGGKYNAMLEIAGGNVLKHMEIPYSTLKPADDSKDANGKFDPDMVVNLLILDATGMLGGPATDNAILFNNIRVMPAK